MSRSFVQDFPPHLLTLEFLTGDQIQDLFRLADRIRHQELSLCERQRLGMIFEKPSTRTRVSFEVAMEQLGGHAVYLSKDDIQLARGESIPDTSRTLSRYVDGLICRTFGHDRVESLAEYASVPVINALTDFAHPCQALADYYTIFRQSKLDNPTLVYLGDGNNVCHSLMVGSWLLDLPLTISAPDGYEPDETLFESLVDRGAPIHQVTEPDQAVEGAQFVYTDVWTSMGDEEEADRRHTDFQSYQVNEDLLERAGDDVGVLHCLPAHRGEEITDAVMDGPHSLVFDQAENRLHVQKALLAVMMGSGDELSDLLD
jgi:ornithine carbamoyltransferase